jgi:flagellar hook protein FlgE
MPRTYEPIATTTATGSSATITFSSFPSTYTDLIIVCAIKGTNANDAYLRYNSDTGSNYSDTTLRGNGSAASSVRNTNVVGIDIGAIANVGANDIGTIIIHIQNYSNATTHKSNLTRFSNASALVSSIAGLWRNTAAITSIDLFNRGGSWVSGSTFTLYGIKAA